jgi:eukaryotic-like serine/threonine-protein kinase
VLTRIELKSTQPLVLGFFGDRYFLQARLGKGGMGEVFQAMDLELKRPVALKILRTDVAGSYDSSEDPQFAIEVRAAANLNHPNIVSVFDGGRCNGRRFFTMMMLPDGSLEEALQQGLFSFEVQNPSTLGRHTLQVQQSIAKLVSRLAE